MDAEQLKSIVKAEDFVICADSGFDKCLGIHVDFLLGDFDSIKSVPENIDMEEFPVHKDFTDSELAVHHALERGYDELLLFGFIGTRFDHTAANLGLLKYIRTRGGMGCIIDSNNEIRLALEDNYISGKKGDIVSIVPYGTDLIGVSTSGLEYPLDNEDLYFDHCRGVSNVMTGEICRIRIKSGNGLIIKSKD